MITDFSERRTKLTTLGSHLRILVHCDLEVLENVFQFHLQIGSAQHLDP